MGRGDGVSPPPAPHGPQGLDGPTRETPRPPLPRRLPPPPRPPLRRAGPPPLRPPRRARGRLGLDTVASASPLMHHGRRRRLTDVLTAIRTGRRVDDLGRAALANAERRLRSEAEMRALLEGHEDAVDRAGDIAARCTFSLDEFRYEYPSEVAPGNRLPAPPPPRPRRAPLALPLRRPRPRDGAPRTRAHPDRQTPLRALLPHRPRRRPVRPLPRHPLPGPRLGRELGCLLLPRRHLRLARDRHDGLRTLRVRGPERTPRHRRRFRTRTARGGDPAHLPALRPPPRRASAPPSSTTAASAPSARWAAPWA
jgi:hypothetical protein